METNDINKKMREIGVSNPSNPTEEDIKMILKSPKDSINVIKDMVDSNKDISKMQMELCDKIIDAYTNDLVKAKTPEESQQIRKEMVDVANIGREETDSHKNSTIIILTIVAVIVGGGGKLLVKKMFGNSI